MLRVSRVPRDVHTHRSDHHVAVTSTSRSTHAKGDAVAAPFEGDEAVLKRVRDATVRISERQELAPGMAPAAHLHGRGRLAILIGSITFAGAEITPALLQLFQQQGPLLGQDPLRRRSHGIRRLTTFVTACHTTR
jgi:hypothetical protein